ncbi:MAG: oligoendopeptidase F [Thermoplasmatota archaeon]
MAELTYPSVKIKMPGNVKLPDRSDVPLEHRWDLSNLYSNDDLWEKDLKKVEGSIPRILKFRGRLAGSIDDLSDCLRYIDDLSRLMEKVYNYSHLRHDENTADTNYQGMDDRAKRMLVNVDTAMSFMVPEILSMKKEDLVKLLEEPKLRFAYVPLREIIRKKDHFLSEKEERIMSMAEEPLESPSKIFRMLNDADLKFPNITDRSGNEVEITHGRFIGFMMDQDRNIREDAFRGFYSSYTAHKNTYCAALEGDFKKRVFRSRIRNYSSSLEASLDSDEVTPEVYTGLIDAVREKLPAMYKYVQLRKRSLGLDRLHMWDVYAPLVKDFEKEVTFDEASEIVISALEPLGEEVQDIIKEGLSGRWIDRFENRGKRSGAYSSGCYDSPPYILMNYDNKVKDLFTLAHEMGHSVHTFLSNRNQPHMTADYRIFVAEVASTVNEILLMNYLRGKWTSMEERTFLVNHHLEGFKGTVFRQTMFAEFERDVSVMVENGIPLTPDSLCELYGKLNGDYFGPDVELDEEIRMEWARIPHFYYNFYVYKYATGYSSATAIARRILEGGDLENYLAMLKAGGSKPPLELLKGAGVDLATPEPVRSALEVFSDLVDEMDGLI